MCALQRVSVRFPSMLLESRIEGFIVGGKPQG